jgi:hypothetical protein
MSRSAGRSATLRDDDDRVRFLDAIGTLIEVGVLIVHAFCLMSNHFHLLCETPVGKPGRWCFPELPREPKSPHPMAGHLVVATPRIRSVGFAQKANSEDLAPPQ